MNMKVFVFDVVNKVGNRHSKVFVAEDIKVCQHWMVDEEYRTWTLELTYPEATVLHSEKVVGV